MKPQLMFALSLIERAQAHYLFGRLIFNNDVSPTFEYVRETGPLGGTDSDLTNPMYNISSPDIRCGRDAYLTGPRTKIATVHAGDEVGFQTGDPLPDVIFHPGPGSAWLSKAPSDNDVELTNYEGDGDWFKIASVVEKPGKDWNQPGHNYTSATDWFLYGLKQWNFTIPKTTPPGKYLLRIEHINPIVTGSQFYSNCAQIDVIGPGGGTPGPLVKIPGVYKEAQKDVNFEPKGVDFNLTKYTAPYPPVWTG